MRKILAYLTKKARKVRNSLRSSEPPRSGGELTPFEEPAAGGVPSHQPALSTFPWARRRRAMPTDTVRSRRRVLVQIQYYQDPDRSLGLWIGILYNLRTKLTPQPPEGRLISLRSAVKNSNSDEDFQRKICKLVWKISKFHL